MSFFDKDVESCCCCFSLRTGNLILGVSNSLASLGSVIQIFEAEGDFNEETQQYDTYSAAHIFLMVVFLIQFIFGVLFVYGVSKGVPKYVRGYYMTYLFFMGLWAFLVVLFVILGRMSMALVILMHFLFDSYIFVVCRSFYRQLISQEEL